MAPHSCYGNLKTDKIVHRWLYIMPKVNVISLKLIGVGHRGVDWQKPIISFQDKWPPGMTQRHLSIATGTWQLLKWLLGIFNLCLVLIDSRQRLVNLWSSDVKKMRFHDFEELHWLPTSLRHSNRVASNSHRVSHINLIGWYDPTVIHIG